MQTPDFPAIPLQWTSSVSRKQFQKCSQRNHSRYQMSFVHRTQRHTSVQTVQASHGKENTGSAQLPLFLTIYIRRLNKINGVQSVGKINSTVRVNCLCPCLAIMAEAIKPRSKKNISQHFI